VDGHLVERAATLRHAELAHLAQASDVARRYRRTHRAQAVAAGEAVRAWRLAVGRRLVSAGLRLGLPPHHRAAAHRDARVLLGE
jgi:hypothetical protein